MLTTTDQKLHMVKGDITGIGTMDQFFIFNK